MSGAIQTAPLTLWKDWQNYYRGILESPALSLRVRHRWADVAISGQNTKNYKTLNSIGADKKWQKKPLLTSM
jgi:hypothetical protein